MIYCHFGCLCLPWSPEYTSIEYLKSKVYMLKPLNMSDMKKSLHVRFYIVILPWLIVIHTIPHEMWRQGCTRKFCNQTQIFWFLLPVWLIWLFLLLFFAFVLIRYLKCYRPSMVFHREDNFFMKKEMLKFCQSNHKCESSIVVVHLILKHVLKYLHLKFHLIFNVAEMLIYQQSFFFLLLGIIYCTDYCT